jgi:ribosomal protein S18 acetylase RimI-like enzyme
MSNTLMVAEPVTGTESVATPAGVALQLLEERDLGAVGEAYWRTYLGTPDEMTLTEATDDVLASWRGDYGRWLADGSLGAWHDGELVGAVLTVTDAPWDDAPPGPFIIDLFVVPGARRRGIGRALVRNVQSRLGVSIALRVDDTAAEARALYTDLGFRARGSGRRRQLAGD